MKKLVTLTVVFALFSSVTVLAQSKKKILTNIIGTWTFSNFYKLAGPEYFEHAKDTCMAMTTYTFNPDGTATIQSKDNSICKINPQPFYWTIVRLHSVGGQSHYAIRLTVDKMPERESYDGNTWNDIILMVTQCRKKVIYWVQKPQYKQAGIGKQSVYNKM